jgi:hypothetical protein
MEAKISHVIPRTPKIGHAPIGSPSIVLSQKRDVNNLASAEQVCDDPCILCGLLLEYMYEGRAVAKYCPL